MSIRGITAGSNVTSAAASDVTFLQSGTGAVSRTVQAKERDIVSAADFATLQAAIDAGHKAIFCPAGNYAPAVIEADGTRLYGAGISATVIVNTSLTGHALKFYPNDTTTTTTFLNNCGVADMTIYSGADKTAGAGIYALQCSGLRVSNVQIQNHPEGLLVSGGQLNVFDRLTVYASSSILTGTPVSSSQAIRLTSAPIDGGLYQNCFTCEFTNTITALSRVIDKGIRIESADGLHFTNGYIAGSYSDEVYAACVTANRYIAGVVFNSMYLDGISMAAAPTNRNAINIPSSALGTVYDMTFNSCLIGNYSGKGCVVGEGMQKLSFTGGTRFVNIDNWAIDFVGDNTTSELTVVGCSFRDVGEVTTNKGGISASTMLSCIITGNSFASISNTGATAISLAGTNNCGQIENNTFVNCTTEVTNGATWTGKICGVPVTYSPAVTFATNGDLSVAYTTQFGQYLRHNNTVTVDFIITTSTFTHTTASGLLQLSLPVNVKTLSNYGAHSAILFQGITKANYTSVAARALSAANILQFIASGSAQTASGVTAADMPTGGTVALRGTIIYEAA